MVNKNLTVKSKVFKKNKVSKRRKTKVFKKNKVSKRRKIKKSRKKRSLRGGNRLYNNVKKFN